MELMAPAPGAALDDPTLYINRELSWLEFNRRVLEEAQDPNVPLLERVKFLAIFESNLDEFFMVRVGGMQQKVHLGIAHGSGADRTPVKQLLDEVTRVVTGMCADAYRCLDEVLPALEREGVVVRAPGQLGEADRRRLSEVFRNQVFPVLTPLAIDPGHPFPHLANKSLNLAVVLRRPGDPDPLFALVQVPVNLPRLVQLPAADRREGVEDQNRSGVVLTTDGRLLSPEVAFTPLETAIRLHLADLFPGMDLLGAVAFRVTRDSEFELDEDVDDLLRAIEEKRPVAKDELIGGLEMLKPLHDAVARIDGQVK